MTEAPVEASIFGLIASESQIPSWLGRYGNNQHAWQLEQEAETYVLLLKHKAEIIGRRARLQTLNPTSSSTLPPAMPHPPEPSQTVPLTGE